MYKRLLSVLYVYSRSRSYLPVPRTKMYRKCKIERKIAYLAPLSFKVIRFRDKKGIILSTVSENKILKPITHDNEALNDGWVKSTSWGTASNRERLVEGKFLPVFLSGTKCGVVHRPKCQTRSHNIT